MQMTRRPTAAALALIAGACLLLPAGSTWSRARRGAKHRRRHAKRCRNIFCTSSVVSINGDAKKGLTSAQVHKVTKRISGQLEPCLLLARRRNPRMRKALIEFVISSAGRVLATRVNGRRRSLLSRCVHKTLKRARFPKNKRRRQVASFSVVVVN